MCWYAAHLKNMLLGRHLVFSYHCFFSTAFLFGNRICRVPVLFDGLARASGLSCAAASACVVKHTGLDRFSDPGSHWLGDLLAVLPAAVVLHAVYVSYGEQSLLFIFRLYKCDTWSTDLFQLLLLLLLFWLTCWLDNTIGHESFHGLHVARALLIFC